MRKLRNYKREIEFSRAVFNFEMTLPDIDEERCYFSEKTGAFMLYMHGHIFHEDEITVAKAFADNGFLVVLTPENSKVYATNKIVKNGNLVYRFSEGWVNGRTFEQSTIELETNMPTVRSVAKSIEHAKLKNAAVAVIFDKFGKLDEESIFAGIKEYESHKTNRYRAENIIVVDKNAEIMMFSHGE